MTTPKEYCSHGSSTGRVGIFFYFSTDAIVTCSVFKMYDSI